MCQHVLVTDEGEASTENGAIVQGFICTDGVSAVIIINVKSLREHLKSGHLRTGDNHAVLLTWS